MDTEWNGKPVIDPELLALGTELAVFHLEAGVGSIANFAIIMAANLGSTIATLRPYLRAWFNGARDMLEDGGCDVAGIDEPDAVLAFVLTVPRKEPGEPELVDLNNWIEQARVSWKENQPQRFAAFKKAGILERELRIAAERTYNEVNELEKAGVSPQDAWEMVRQEYLFPPPEPETTHAPATTPGLEQFEQIAAQNGHAMHKLLTSGE